MSTLIPEKLRDVLGADIPDDLWQLALTHPSVVGEGIERTLHSNQRLEFLGDAIVGAAIADYWYRTQSTLPEGELTQRKAAVVQKKALAGAAARLQLGELIRVGRGADAMTGRGRDAVLADAFEAIVGALFLALGWKGASEFVVRALQPELDAVALIAQTANIKNLLQEHTQATALGTPTYLTTQTGGPAHARQFLSQVVIQDTVRGRGRGASKKEAECRAAEEAMQHLQKPAKA